MKNSRTSCRGSLTAIGLATLGGLALALAAPGCNTKAYCFHDCGEIAAGGAEDTSSGSNTGGLIGLQTDSGSSTGAKAGAEAGAAGAWPVDVVPQCEDTESDPLNCGACGFVCEITAAIPACVDGECVIDSCASGRYDLNDDPEDGCEYRCLPTGDDEVCDGVDNDCDGDTDEGFELDTDPDNCGACGNSCSLFSATAECAQPDPDQPAVCVVGECAEGFHDANQVGSDGCEYECTPTGDEVCDALDNDCDGVFNEELPGTGEPCEDLCPDGICQGQCTPGVTSCVGTEIVCRPGEEHLGQELEVCDGVDNDCDGDTDEGFDTDTDVKNCGACGNVCSFPNATGVCVDGQCAILTCLPGFGDVDTTDTAPGCEYECPVDPPTEEVCNGLDDDCDGVADNTELLEDLRPPIEICAPPSGHTFSGTPCAGASVGCLGEEGWRCVYTGAVETDADGFVVVTESLCDGEDGNCDGNVDESFTDVGTSCDNGEVGACRDAGERACDPDDPTQTYCDFSVLPDAVPSSTEICNAIDDDCDGDVDEDTEDSVLIDLSGSGGPTFYIDRYEAARPDATSTDPGLIEAYPCTKSGVLPWASSSFAEAEAACVAVGRRLCTAEELRLACGSGTGLDYPYGASYEQDTCNGLDYGSGSTVATGSLSGCVTGDGVVDLSGNVAEWSSTVTGSTGGLDPLDIIQVFGGSFMTPANGMACSFDLARITTNAVTPSIGFRCCSDGP